MSTTKFSFPLGAPPVPNEVRIGDRVIGYGHPAFVIAEIGNNHNGDMELARKSVLAAHVAGADAVKFQKRCLDEVFTKEMLAKVNDRITSPRTAVFGPTYGAYRAKLELNAEQLSELKELAHSFGMAFFVTPFDLKSVDFLAELGMDAWKVSSFDVTHPQLIEAIAKKGQPIFLSTGMSTLEERDQTVALILPHNPNLVVFHCVSVYPTKDKDLNIGAITTLRERYAPLPVGYSGHEKGFIPTIAAVALGACAIERHFTLDNTLDGPDHETVSLEYLEFGSMVKEIRRIEKAVADRAVYIHSGEVGHREKHGKSIVARYDILAGSVIQEDMLACKSTGRGGISPMLMHTVVGKRARIEFAPDHVIAESDLDAI